MKCLALDFGGSSVKYGIVDDHAVITNRGRVPAPLESRAQFQETVSSLYEQFKAEVDGIAISLPGHIDPRTGYLSGSGAYQALYGCCIPELLQEQCNVKVCVENDGKCGALSESWNGALKGCQDGVVLILGSAIAGGVIKDGKIHSGKGFTAGEFSFMLIEAGKYSYSAMSMLHNCTVGMTYKLCKQKNIDLTVQDSRDTLLVFDSFLGAKYPSFAEEPRKIKVSGEQIMQWVEEGDLDAVTVYNEFIESLAMMIFNIQIIYAPEKIVIGGGLSRSDRVLRDLQEGLGRYYDSLLLFNVFEADIVRSRYLDECNLLGAAYNFMCRVGKTA